MKQEDQYQQLSRHLGAWSWMHVLYLYDETHLLIADEWFIDHVRNARPSALMCRTARTNSYEKLITKDTKKILVFSEQGELGIIRELRATYPDILITSGTYGFAVTGRDRYPRLKEFKPAAGSKEAAPVVILSTPYADAEFVAEVMLENGFPFAVEYLGRPYATWLKLHKGFQISRFYNTVENHFADKGRLYYLAQTDVLESLFENSSFSLERFIAYLQKSGAKVILVERSSVMAQATMGQLLHQTAERSIWTKKPSKKVHIKADGADFLKSWDQRKTILRGVSILDKVEQASVDTMRVTLEEFADHQARHMKDIASFLSVDMGEEVVELAYASKFGMAPDIYPMAAQFQRELIDRLGLHIDLPE